MPDPWVGLHKIVDKAAPKFVRAFLQAVADSQSVATKHLRAIQKALKQSNTAAVMRAIDWEAIAEVNLTPKITKALRDVLESAGVAAVIPGTTGIAFDIVNPEIAGWVRNESGLLIQNINKQTLLGIRNIVNEAFAMGHATPAAQIFTQLEYAAHIKESLGLNRIQVGALQKYRIALRKRGVTGPLYQKLVERYRKKLLTQRAWTIARTESMEAANEGNRIHWRDSVKKGYIDPTRYENKWVVTPDDLLCDNCRTMRNARRPINGVYRIGRGAGTRGPTLHPRCRCIEILVAVIRRASIRIAA
jgi:hypothetical protein